MVDMNFDTSRLLKLTFTYIRQRIRNIKGKYAKLSGSKFEGCFYNVTVRSNIHFQIDNEELDVKEKERFILP